jgi:hypothetical protein
MTTRAAYGQRRTQLGFFVTDGYVTHHVTCCRPVAGMARAAAAALCAMHSCLVVLHKRECPCIYSAGRHEGRLLRVLHVPHTTLFLWSPACAVLCTSVHGG